MKSESSSSFWRQRKTVFIFVVVVLLGGVLLGASRWTSRASTVPTTLVTREAFTDFAQFRGEAKALKSVTITAPSRAGDLQIIQLARNGSRISKNDVVVQFDATKLQQDMAQQRSALKSAEAEIEQARAQARLKEEQDLTDLMKARYAVESAKLDASKQEILSKIDGKEADLALADAEQRLRQAEEQLKSDRAADSASIESKKHQRDKAFYDVQQTEHSLASLTLRAPIAGMITILQNWRSGGPFGSSPEFKQGDRAWPGAGLVELPDLSTLRVTARANETERSHLELGQTANVHMDAIPDSDFTGHVAEISSTASTDFSGGWPFPRDFSLQLTLDSTDARIRPGMSATVRIAVERIPDAIVVPAEALFQKSGRTVSYVLQGSEFQERIVQVGRRSGSRVLIASGLRPAERVALTDPTAKE
jgi:HlyD family secretion protein